MRGQVLIENVVFSLLGLAFFFFAVRYVRTLRQEQVVVPPSDQVNWAHILSPRSRRGDHVEN